MNLKYFLIPLLIGSVLTGCNKSENDEQTETTQEELVKSVNVSAITVANSSLSSFLKVVGTVETSNDIQLSAEVGGKITSYRVNQGDAIKKGQIIAEIDDAKLKQELARLTAITSQAKENYERLKRVYDEDGIGSELDYLNAKYNYEQSKSALESLKVDIENTSVKAPFNGILERKMVETGEMVSPGVPIVRLIGSDSFKITAGVPARYADAIKVGDKVDVWFDAQVRDTIQAAITFAGVSIDPQNRTFRIEVKLPEGKKYKVDMIANMQLKTAEETDAIVLSEEYVYSKNDKYVVYKLAENSEGKAIAKEQEVNLGLSYKTDVVITDGLTEGEQVITLGSAFLDDGMRVSVKETTIASN